MENTLEEIRELGEVLKWCAEHAEELDTMDQLNFAMTMVETGNKLKPIYAKYHAMDSKTHNFIMKL